MSVLAQGETTDTQKLKIIAALAVPAMIEHMLQIAVGFVDTLFVAKLGLVEVTAVGVTNAIIAVYLAMFMAIGTGTSALIAKSVGAGDWEQARAIARQSAWLSGALGVVFGLATLLFAGPMLRWMGAEPDVLADGVVYFRIVGVPSVLLALTTVFGSILRAAGNTKTPMKVGVWVNAVHIGLDYILIFGLFSLPGLGIAGAAWATVLARMVGVVALYVSIRKSKLSLSLSLPFPFSLSLSLRTATSAGQFARPLLRLSAPAAAERLIMRFGQVLYFGLIVRLGTDVYAAHTIAGNIEILSYMPGMGLAVAATTLVGQCIGANRPEDAYRYGLLTTGAAVAWMTVAGALLFAASPFAAAWFTDRPDVIGMVTTALRIDAFAQPFLAAGLVLTGALQGAGDTKSPMYSTAVGMWLIRVAGVYVLSVVWGLGIAGVWLSIAIDLAVRALFLWVAFSRKLRCIIKTNGGNEV